MLKNINYSKYFNFFKNGVYLVGNGIYNLTNNIIDKIKNKKGKKITGKDMLITIEKLKNIQNNISTRINNIELKIENFYQKAKEFYDKNNKKSALFNLKLKKMYLNEKNKLDKINFNIEAQIFTLDSFGIIYDTADILKDSAIKINLINNNIDIEKIENTIEELNELSDINTEVQDIFDNGNNDIYDDDELLKELEPKKEEENICYIPPVKKNKDIDTNINELNKKLPKVPTRQPVLL